MSNLPASPDTQPQAPNRLTPSEAFRIFVAAAVGGAGLGASGQMAYEHRAEDMGCVVTRVGDHGGVPEAALAAGRTLAPHMDAAGLRVFLVSGIDGEERLNDQGLPVDDDTLVETCAARLRIIGRWSAKTGLVYSVEQLDALLEVVWPQQPEPLEPTLLQDN